MISASRQWLHVANCWRRGRRRRRTYAKGGDLNQGSVNSERVKRTSANDATLAKQSADHFCFPLKTHYISHIYIYIFLYYILEYVYTYNMHIVCYVICTVLLYIVYYTLLSLSLSAVAARSSWKQAVHDKHHRCTTKENRGLLHVLLGCGILTAERCNDSVILQSRFRRRCH